MFAREALSAVRVVVNCRVSIMSGFSFVLRQDAFADEVWK